MSLELVAVFESPGLQLGPVFDVSGPPAFLSVSPTTTGATVAYTGAVTHYRVDGGSAVAVPSNPFTFAGLAPNTEPHTVELSGDGGSSWPVTWTFGTLNPGAGGGEIPTGIHAASALQFSLVGTAAGSAAVRAASSVAVQLAGSSQAGAGGFPGLSAASSITFTLSAASSGVVGSLPPVAAASAAALQLAGAAAAQVSVSAQSAGVWQLAGGSGQLAVYDLTLLRRVVAGKPAVRTVRGTAY